MRRILCLATACLKLLTIPCQGEETKVTSVSTEPYTLKYSDTKLELKGPSSYQMKILSALETKPPSEELDKWEGVNLSFDMRSSVAFKSGVSGNTNLVLILHSSDGQKIEIPRNSATKLLKVTIDLEIEGKTSQVIVWRPRE